MIPPASCSKIVPDSWREGVEAAPIPDNTPIAEWLGKPLTQVMAAAILAPWAAGYTAMSGQLEKANGRTVDTIDIIVRCETLVNDARPDS